MSYNLHQAQSHEILRCWQAQRTDFNHHKDFVLPVFVGNDDDSVESIEGMPDVYRYGCNRAIEYLEPLVYSFGLRAVLLFPVVTKSKREEQELVDGEDEDDSDQDIISSSDLSASQSSRPSSTSSDEQQVSVLRERLLPVDEPTTLASSQNPFLNQNEEEQDHLLGEQGEPVQLETEPRSMVSPPVIRVEQPIDHSRSLDVKLIKGMALKDKYNPVLRIIPRLREKFPELLIICDVCLCAFTSTGHCCLFDDKPKGAHNHSNFQDQHARLASLGASTSNIMGRLTISNKITCQYLAMLAVEYAFRGCNVVAPSDMMDGRILTIREKLDENKLQHVSILSYAAKFASAFYGPFRAATNNAPEFGDRRSYQLPPGSRAMAMKAVQRDINQGADFVMVKPGGHFLDIVRDIRQEHPNVPIAIYQVSGEYAMLKLAAKEKILDLKVAVNEILASYRRAGATIIISYFTPELLRGEL